MPFDDTVGDWLLGHLRARGARSPLFLEGGALESNGAGTFLTTESCVLNDNRNPGLTREVFEDALGKLVEVSRVVWLERGLEHDHTDGHVDMIARFASADTVLCMEPAGDVPNAGVMREIASVLRDEGFSVLPLPAPRAVFDREGAPLPASYCNFYVANEAVIVPNAVLVGSAITNYSRLADENGAIVGTNVTIGYDTPWRQVHAMLELAAARTSGVRKESKPFVLQRALSDFYPEYQLVVHLDRAEQRIRALSDLHANIQDVFNEYGVQIMSPNFVAQPAEKIWVPKDQWRAAPAAGD
jgi:hypothetical protein